MPTRTCAADLEDDVGIVVLRSSYWCHSSSAHCRSLSYLQLHEKCGSLSLRGRRPENHQNQTVCCRSCFPCHSYPRTAESRLQAPKPVVGLRPPMSQRSSWRFDLRSLNRRRERVAADTRVAAQRLGCFAEFPRSQDNSIVWSDRTTMSLFFFWFWRLNWIATGCATIR